MTSPKDDADVEHDSIFKQLIRTFFRYFVELFMPAFSELVVWESVEFLDKELFIDIRSGDVREVDLLVKLLLRQPEGQQAFCVIHIENQAKRQRQFVKRMFHYFARLDEEFDLPVYPIALLSYDSPANDEPDQYVVEFPGRKVLNFQFHRIQLNQLSWRDFIEKPNPVACALMAKMKIEPGDRPKVKLQCLRMLATLRLDPAKSRLVATFMNSYLKLTAAEAAVYNQELTEITPEEREDVMQLTNEWIEEGERKGIEKGMERGIQLGLHQGQRQTANRLLAKRFGGV